MFDRLHTYFKQSICDTGILLVEQDWREKHHKHTRTHKTPLKTTKHNSAQHKEKQHDVIKGEKNQEKEENKK